MGEKECNKLKDDFLSCYRSGFEDAVFLIKEALEEEQIKIPALIHSPHVKKIVIDGAVEIFNGKLIEMLLLEKGKRNHEKV